MVTMSDKTTEFKLDSVVSGVISKYILRAELGMKKYGTNLDRNDLKVLDWIKHVQEEMMDAVLYLEKLTQEIKKENLTKFDGDMMNLGS
jgi:hypothetical protein